MPTLPVARAIALKRIVITEALRDPDFARTLYEEIHLPSVRELARILNNSTTDGRAEIDDPMAAASLFFAIVMSDAQLQALVEGDDRADRRRRARLAAGALPVALQDRLNPVPLYALDDLAPTLAEGAWAAPSADLIGDVRLGAPRQHLVRGGDPRRQYADPDRRGIEHPGRRGRPFATPARR